MGALDPHGLNAFVMGINMLMMLSLAIGAIVSAILAIRCCKRPLSGNRVEFTAIHARATIGSSICAGASVAAQFYYFIVLRASSGMQLNVDATAWACWSVVWIVAFAAGLVITILSSWLLVGALDGRHWKVAMVMLLNVVIGILNLAALVDNAPAA